MSDLPKRPWFRFHLLTLLLMTSAAGVWLGLNCHATHVSTPNGEQQVENWNYRGWPMTWSADVYYTHAEKVVLERTLVIPALASIIDIAIGLALCLLVGFLSEFLQRCSARQP